MSLNITLAKLAIGDSTPLCADCGVLCGKACCGGSDTDGMLLFPGESTSLNVIEAEGGRLAVCGGSCERHERPLACMFFPFFPCIDENGKVSLRLDSRAKRICPIAAENEKVRFSRFFLRRTAKAGRILAKDKDCAAFMRDVTEQIELIDRFY